MRRRGFNAVAALHVDTKAMPEPGGGIGVRVCLHHPLCFVLAELHRIKSSGRRSLRHVANRRPLGRPHSRGSSEAELGLPTNRTRNRQSHGSDAVGEGTRGNGGGANGADTSAYVCASFWSARSGQCRLRRVPGTTQRRGPAERPAAGKGMREIQNRRRSSRVSPAISDAAIPARELHRMFHFFTPRPTYLSHTLRPIGPSRPLGWKSPGS